VRLRLPAKVISPAPRIMIVSNPVRAGQPGTVEPVYASAAVDFVLGAGMTTPEDAEETLLPLAFVATTVKV
jgi:hypothetical protein